ncbi:Mitochondrial distribution and morphology protein 35 [Trichoderma lentiforme]|uniref:Mitochondrial distribution and morphology protein 35 n=1 Tax=Trichoderma lentiforme TaxID=1567552 RepID=A0A9P5C9W6_9HYPO|nr:Mitochondrial distribution and morphology protein 35 [Trichoderma lentiforme]
MSASLAPECNEVKERYDTCFLKWYSEKYLRGAEKDNKECAGLFNEYQKCLSVALKNRGIDKLLDEAREDNKENDSSNVWLDLLAAEKGMPADALACGEA